MCVCVHVYSRFDQDRHACYGRRSSDKAARIVLTIMTLVLVLADEAALGSVLWVSFFCSRRDWHG